MLLRVCPRPGWPCPTTRALLAPDVGHVEAEKPCSRAHVLFEGGNRNLFLFKSPAPAEPGAEFQDTVLLVNAVCVDEFLSS